MGHRDEDTLRTFILFTSSSCIKSWIEAGEVHSSESERNIYSSAAWIFCFITAPKTSLLYKLFHTVLQLKKKRPHEVDILNQHKKTAQFKVNLNEINLDVNDGSFLTYLQVICVTVLLRRRKRLFDLWIIISLRLKSSLYPKPNNTDNKKHSGTKKRSRNCQSNRSILLPSAFLSSILLPSVLCASSCRTCRWETGVRCQLIKWN